MKAGERDGMAADRLAKPPAGRRTRDHAGKNGGSRQLSLFDIERAVERAAPAKIKAPPAVKASAVRSALNRPAARGRDQQASRVLCVGDMPDYCDAAHESVAAAIEALPKTQLWFTYKDIQFFFGVSRATVARRLREGLVPGVRMAGANVMEDAAVRRFDRDQLKWLLLALRHRTRQHTTSQES